MRHTGFGGLYGAKLRRARKAGQVGGRDSGGGNEAFSVKSTTGGGEGIPKFSITHGCCGGERIKYLFKLAQRADRYR